MSKPIAPPPGLKWVIRKTRRTSVAAELELWDEKIKPDPLGIGLSVDGKFVSPLASASVKKPSQLRRASIRAVRDYNNKLAADLALAANLNAMQAALDATHRNREAN